MRSLTQWRAYAKSSACSAAFIWRIASNMWLAASTSAILRDLDIVVQPHGLDSFLGDGACGLAASTFAHEYRPALNGFEAVSAGEESDQEGGDSHLCRLLRVVCVQESLRASREAPL